MGIRERLAELEATYSPDGDRGPAVWSPHHDSHRNAQNLGGDKARTNGYAPAYGELLEGREPAVLVELGVFQGTSMAVWCDLFHRARIIGLDIDPSRFQHERLIELGAFARNIPHLHEWDAYLPDAEALEAAAGAPIDVFVDDGPHTKTAILRVAQAVKPLMAEGSVYIVEDHEEGARFLKEVFHGAEIRQYGRLNAALL
jgi:cephalosporin hydroxylase